MTDELESLTSAEGAGEAEDQESSAGTEKSEKSPMIPKARFDEVNQRMKRAEEQNEELASRLEDVQAKLEQLATRSSGDQDSKLPQPPGNLSRDEQVKWYVENYSRAMLEREFGMPLQELKTLFQAIPETSRNASMLQYQRNAEAAGLDPTDKETAKYVGTLMKGGAKMEDAIAFVARALGKKPPKKVPPQLETDGVVPMMVQDNAFADTPEEAVKLASQGKTIPHRRFEDVIRRSKKLARK